MTSVWGGPDKLGPNSNSTPASPGPNQASLPGFDEFAVTRFSPLSWSIPAAPGFSAKDAQARQVLQEIAGMQTEILKKVGPEYADRLRSELGSMGIGQQAVEEYLRMLCASVESVQKGKEWKQFFVRFLEQAQM
jgi:exportin-T